MFTNTFVLDTFPRQSCECTKLMFKQKQKREKVNKKASAVCLLQRIKCECDETTIDTMVLEAREKVFNRVRT